MRSLALAAALALALAAGPASADRDGAGMTAALERAPPAGGEAPSAAASDDQAPATLAPAPAQVQRLGNPLWAIPLRALTATRDRPLFSPSRRPLAPVVPSAPSEPAPAAAPVAAAPAPPERPQMTLVGTIVGAEARFALLEDETTHVVDRVREGDTESGWRIRAVLERSIVVEKGAQSVTLGLPAPGETSGAPAEAEPQADETAPPPPPPRPPKLMRDKLRR